MLEGTGSHRATPCSSSAARTQQWIHFPGPALWAGQALTVRALTVRAHVTAQVAAVLENLAAGATLMDTFMLTQLPYKLPPNAMPARQNQAPLESNGAAWMMREPAQERNGWSRRDGGWVLRVKVSDHSHLKKFLSHISQLHLVHEERRRKAELGSHPAPGSKDTVGAHTLASALSNNYAAHLLQPWPPGSLSSICVPNKAALTVVLVLTCFMLTLNLTSKHFFVLSSVLFLLSA